jgi:hypothetical protein
MHRAALAIGAIGAFYALQARQKARSTAAATPSKRLRVVLIRHGESFNNVCEQISNTYYNKHRQPE